MISYTSVQAQWELVLAVLEEPSMSVDAVTFTDAGISDIDTEGGVQ